MGEGRRMGKLVEEGDGAASGGWVTVPAVRATCGVRRCQGSVAV